MTCEARKGFLTLSGCENPVASACSNCGRSMCTAHLAPQTGFSMCFDCAATNQNVQEQEYDDVWSRRYRNDYYTTTGYVPLYSSYHGSRYYDRQDAQSFDDTVRDHPDDDVDRGGFGES
ncbi:MAG TPA: hypothetical protein VGQ36_28715 [Thermoanaerobaculia bacterium]|jgi:hypothetical protein|nr:hypothetical protein [Thermoanaerobaculia bacterium]